MGCSRSLGHQEEVEETKSSSKRTLLKWILWIAAISALAAIVAVLVAYLLAKYSQYNLTRRCVETYDQYLDYFPYKAQARVAESFSVLYNKHYKVLFNLESRETFVLVQCGTPWPTDNYPNAKYFEVPMMTGVAVSETVHLTYIEVCLFLFVSFVRLRSDQRVPPLVAWSADVHQVPERSSLRLLGLRSATLCQWRDYGTVH